MEIGIITFRNEVTMTLTDSLGLLVLPRVQRQQWNQQNFFSWMLLNYCLRCSWLSLVNLILLRSIQGISDFCSESLENQWSLAPHQLSCSWSEDIDRHVLRVLPRQQEGTREISYEAKKPAQSINSNTMVFSIQEFCSI